MARKKNKNRLYLDRCVVKWGLCANRSGAHLCYIKTKHDVHICEACGTDDNESREIYNAYNEDLYTKETS